MTERQKGVIAMDRTLYIYSRLAAGKPAFVTSADALETTRIMDAAYHGNAPIRHR